MKEIKNEYRWILSPVLNKYLENELTDKLYRELENVLY